ncbi:MAG: cytochrome-c oxidase, cbb3-type subunit II [Chromatiaceae bacterium]|jgi:cytochrome c oxidase cbb3-type subunit 2|nr:cytochrome-c oxidase, cbb3-type subunit II [Chromatiaceae bacterium]
MAENTSSKSFQGWMEQNIVGLLIVLAIALSVGGIVEIVPLFYLKGTFPALEKNPEIVWAKAGQEPIVSVADGKQQWNWKPGDGVRPYTALELAGRDVYQREGCYLCHSQMIRPFRDENERYGHYSLASESIFDHPFQWGSKRTGPDIARVGGKYSDEWHRAHLRAPRSVVPESVMPNYPWLDNSLVDGATMQKHMNGMKTIGVPYSDADVEAAPALVDGKTEMDAVVAYLQVLGTMAKLQDDVVYRE